MLVPDADRALLVVELRPGVNLSITDIDKKAMYQISIRYSTSGPLSYHHPWGRLGSTHLIYRRQ